MRTAEAPSGNETTIMQRRRNLSRIAESEKAPLYSTVQGWALGCVNSPLRPEEAMRWDSRNLGPTLLPSPVCTSWSIIHQKLKYTVFKIIFTDVIDVSRQNASISCVKFSWTNQYVYSLVFPLPTHRHAPPPIAVQGEGRSRGRGPWASAPATLHICETSVCPTDSLLLRSAARSLSEKADTCCGKMSSK